MKEENGEDKRREEQIKMKKYTPRDEAEEKRQGDQEDRIKPPQEIFLEMRKKRMRRTGEEKNQ